MTQERLNGVAIMATENDVLQNINFQDILNDFTTAKLRQKNFEDLLHKEISNCKRHTCSLWIAVWKVTTYHILSFIFFLNK